MIASVISLTQVQSERLMNYACAQSLIYTCYVRTNGLLWWPGNLECVCPNAKLRPHCAAYTLHLISSPHLIWTGLNWTWTAVQFSSEEMINLNAPAEPCRCHANGPTDGRTDGRTVLQQPSAARHKTPPTLWSKY